MRYTHYNGSPGNGKTTLMHNNIAQTTGKYLIAVPRIKLAEEQYHELKAKLAHANPLALAMRIHTDHNDNIENTSDIPVSLKRQIASVPRQTLNMEHVAVIVTHASMMASDLSEYKDWDAYIDEIPNCIKSGSIKIPVIASYLNDIIKLEPIGNSGWSYATLKSKAPSQGLLDADICLRSMTELFSKMRGQFAVCLRTTDLGSFAGKTDRLEWFSYWDLNSLKMFKSVTVVGAGLTDSILYKAMKDDIEWEVIDVGSNRTIRPEVNIHYFTRGHRSSTRLWDTPFGNQCIDAVGQFLGQLPADQYYWSANDSIQPRLQGHLKGTFASPKSEGTNEYLRFNTVALLYSAKSQPIADRGLRDILKLTKNDIRKAREDWDMRQFVLRGSLRDWQCSKPYTIYVYDQWQADMLASYINDEGIGHATTHGIPEAGIMDLKPPSQSNSTKNGKSKNSQTYEQRKQKDRLRKRAKREEQDQIKAANGTKRSRGRPRKALQASMIQNPAPTSGVSPTGP